MYISRSHGMSHFLSINVSLFLKYLTFGIHKNIVLAFLSIRNAFKEDSYKAAFTL